MKRKFVMTKKQFEKILEASRPTPVMYLSGGIPLGRPPQENANLAWQQLADKMGFIWDTVEPIPGAPQTEFMAEPK